MKRISGFSSNTEAAWKLTHLLLQERAEQTENQQLFLDSSQN